MDSRQHSHVQIADVDLYSLEDQARIAVGSTTLKRAGLLNFGLSKPCYRQSAVNILTKSSHVTGADPACTQDKHHSKALAAYRKVKKYISSSLPEQPQQHSTATRGSTTISTGAESGGCTDQCSSNATAACGDIKHVPLFSLTGLRAASSANNSIDSAGLTAGSASNTVVTVTTLISSNGCIGPAQPATPPQNGRDRISSSGSSGIDQAAPTAANSEPACTRVTSARAAALRVLPKTYTAALLRRQQAQATAKLRQQDQQQQQKRKVKLQLMQPLGNSSNCSSSERITGSAAALTVDTAAAHCRLSFLPPEQSVISPLAGHHSTASSPDSSASSIPGLHLSHLRRVSHPSYSSDTGPSQPCSPAAAAAAAAAAAPAGHGGFFGDNSLTRANSNSSSNSNSSGNSFTRDASREGRLQERSRPHSLLLTALDVATAANSRAAAALRAAARRATRTAAAAKKPPSKVTAATGTAAQNSRTELAAAAVDFDQAAVTDSVLGWYHAAAGTGGADGERQSGDAVVCVVAATNNGTQQHCSCPAATVAAAAGDNKSRAKCICGVGYSRLQRGDSLKLEQQQQQKPADFVVAADDVELVEQQDAAATMSQQQQQLKVVLQQPNATSRCDIGSGSKNKSRSSGSGVHNLIADADLASPFWQASPAEQSAVQCPAAAAVAVVAVQPVQGGKAPEEAAGPQVVHNGSEVRVQAVVMAREAAAARAGVTTGLGEHDCAHGKAPGEAAVQLPVIPAGCACHASVVDLLAASTHCIADLEGGFAQMQLTAQHLAESQLPLRCRFGGAALQ